MFRLFTDAGLKTPKFGIVRDLVPKLTDWIDHPKAKDLIEIIVYLDEFSHRGENKIKCSCEEALEKYPDHFASEFFMVNRTGTGVSYRYLRAGLKQFWLRYSSSDDWRSNYGDVHIELLSAEKENTFDEHVEKTKFMANASLIAVDYIRIGGKLLAIDLNLAPGMRCTGIEKTVPAKEMAHGIKSFLVSYNKIKEKI